MMAFGKWFKVALVNLFIVVFLGVILRYKIAFSLPFIDQKNLLQAHSHFAFSGWITQALMTMIVFVVFKNGSAEALSRYRSVLILNLVAAFGMLVSFPFEGYGFVSIVFSTLSLVVSYIFAYMFFKDANLVQHEKVWIPWFKAGVMFNALSSLGALSLAFMMATHQLYERLYLSAIYFFLHFQYNGWFIFACLGLLMRMLEKAGVSMDFNKTVFRLFFYSCFPAYFLSVLWLKLPWYLNVIIVLAAIAQLAGWIIVVRNILKEKVKLKSALSKQAGLILKLSAIAFSIKLLLQLGSTHPHLSQIAFGFRPIVIGYLHLVLLGVTTLFLLSWMMAEKVITVSKSFYTGMIVFTTGIILNEIMLMLQGVMGMQNKSVEYTNAMLFGIAIVMFIGTGAMIVSRKEGK